MTNSAGDNAGFSWAAVTMALVPAAAASNITMSAGMLYQIGF